MLTGFEEDHPLSVKANQSGEFTLGEEFPALKHFFPCTQAAGNTVCLQDIVGGIWLAPNNYLKPDDYSMTPGANRDNLPLERGRWMEFTNNPTLILLVGLFGPVAYFGIGRSAVGIPEIMMRTDFIGCQVNDGITTRAATAGTNASANQAYGIKIDYPNNQLVSFQTNASNVYSENAALPLTDIYDVIGIPNYSSLGGATYNQALYGIAIFRFNKQFPADLAQAIPWTVTNWTTTTDKTIWPAWKHLI